jgi:hypothetical protein
MYLPCSDLSIKEKKKKKKEKRKKEKEVNPTRLARWLGLWLLGSITP